MEIYHSSLRYRNKGKRWTVQEENIILSMFHKHTLEEISNVLMRPPHTALAKMHKLGIYNKRINI